MHQVTGPNTTHTHTHTEYSLQKHLQSNGIPSGRRSYRSGGRVMFPMATRLVTNNSISRLYTCIETPVCPVCDVPLFAIVSSTPTRLCRMPWLHLVLVSFLAQVFRSALVQMCQLPSFSLTMTEFTAQSPVYTISFTVDLPAFCQTQNSLGLCRGDLIRLHLSQRACDDLRLR